MGCSHTRECPLFPLLNASLRDWRNYYCDSGDGWQDCARYKLSKTGQLVPITLLPNGHDALHLRGIPSADGSDVDGSRHVPRPRPAPELTRASAVRFEPAPAPEPMPIPEPMPTPQRVPVPAFNQAPPVQIRHHSGIPPVRPARPPRRRWWTRLADWIAGPA